MTLKFDTTQATPILEALGLPTDTEDPDLIAATVADLVAQAAGIDAEKPSTIAAAAKKAGLEVIDTDTADTLRRDAAEGRKIVAAARAKVEAAVDDAINHGKITPWRRKHWVSLIEADPAMADVLAAVPMTEVGHAADSADDLAEAGQWFY